MCGRFAFYSPSEAAAALFGVSGTPHLEPRYNIAPTDMVAAARQSPAGGREFAWLRWGLIPSWAKDRSIGNRMINARAETVAEKPAFRAAFRQRRCIVPADGFYEWHKDEKGKTPFFISQATGEVLAFAGLWETWIDYETGESLQTAVIITTAANPFLARLHDRMPVVLTPENAERWLAGQADPRELAAAAPAFRAWPVSRRVNQAANEGADLIDAVGEELPGRANPGPQVPL